MQEIRFDYVHFLTCRSGRTSNTSSKIVPVQLLPNNNDTIITTAGAPAATAADPSIDEGGVKGLKVATNTNSESLPQLLQQ